MIHDLFNRYSRHVEFMGEEITDVNQIGNFGSQLIHLASFSNQCRDIEVLLDAGADVNALGDLGLSAAHYAALGGAREAVSLLIDRGINTRLENEFGETAEQLAYLLGHSEIREMLQSVDGYLQYNFDKAENAKNRWLAFRSIQRANFWVET